MKTLKGKNGVLVFEMSEREFASSSEESMGICLNCGESRDECEPDAENYECYECGTQSVFGVEQLLLIGRITIV